LETHKKACERSFLWLHVNQVLTLEENGATSYLIMWMANKNLQRKIKRLIQGTGNRAKSTNTFLNSLFI